MKVLHVAPSIAQSYGGPTHSLAGYAVASRHAGIDFSIAAPDCEPADKKAFISRAGEIDLHLFQSFGTAAFAISPALVRWIRRSAKSFDIVHVHGLFNTISSLSARNAHRSGTAVVVRPFGTLSRYTFRHRRTALKRAYFELIERKNLRDAAALHFTTEAERSEANWHGIDFNGRAHIVPPPAPDEAVAHLPYDATAGAPRVLFIGRINPVKNLEVLLDAWPRVRRKVPGALLDIAGDGDPKYVAALQRQAARNGHASSVTFHGFVTGEKKNRLLSLATLLALPSHHENFGVVVLEAVQAGVPVVVSPEVHLADFVRAERLGRVAGANPPNLADAIVELLDDDSTKLRARELGAKIVARNFSASAIGELLLKMYRAAAAERSRHVTAART